VRSGCRPNSAKVGIAGAFDGAMRYAANPSLISRAHFGRYLVESGACKDLRSVFESYLVPGRPGYVDHRWATLADSLAWIHWRRGLVATVAHPGRYKLSRGDMRRFLAEFRDLGGQAIEVVSGSHTPEHVDLFGRWPGSMAFWPRAAPISTDRARVMSIWANWRRCRRAEARLESVLSLRERAPWHSTSRFIPTTRRRGCCRRVAEVIRQGGVIALPTDSSYALGCQLGDKAAVERIRRSAWRR
jgi:hypothetical protein